MTESQMRDRVKMLLREAGSDGDAADHVLLEPTAIPPSQALQVLALAQRTAEDHMAAARREAEVIRADATATADQIVAAAKEQASTTRAQADRMLAESRVTAEQIVREAQTRADELQREAEQLIASAGDQAASLIRSGQEEAKQLALQARYRYEDAVGGLAAKREALQEQIESLEAFDAEYRRRLTTFMQGQLRSLWTEEPKVAMELLTQISMPGGPVGDAQPDGAGAGTVA